MKRTYSLASAVAIAAAVWGAGCDDRPAPQPDLSGADAPSAATRPATEPSALANRDADPEVAKAPRKTMELGSFPCTIEAPDSWKLTSAGTPGREIFSIVGPAPSGPVFIQLVSGTLALPADTLGVMEVAARKEQRDHPDTILKAEFRPLDRAKVLEKRVISHQPATQFTAQGKTETVEAADLVVWTVMVLDPRERGAKYKPYTMAFIGLRREQYDKDRAFLEGIVNSLKYNPMAGGPI